VALVGDIAGIEIRSLTLQDLIDERKALSELYGSAHIENDQWRIDVAVFIEHLPAITNIIAKCCDRDPESIARMPLADAVQVAALVLSKNMAILSDIDISDIPINTK